MGLVIARRVCAASACLFALLSFVSAQTSVCGGSRLIPDPRALLTFNDQFGDNCSKDPDFRGDITVRFIDARSVSGTNLSLSSIRTIEGSLTFDRIGRQRDATDWTVDLSGLGSVSQNLTFSNLQNFMLPNPGALSSTKALIFHNVEFVPTNPLNRSVVWGGAQGWGALRSLTSLSFVNTTVTEILRTHEYIEPVNAGETAYVTVVDNSELITFDLYGYGDTNVNIEIRDNAHGLRVNLKIVVVGSLRISGVNNLTAPAINTLPATEGMGPNLNHSISGNTISTLSLPSLSTVSGNLEIENNSALAQLDLHDLNYVQGLSIANNPLLRSISLPNLTDVETSLMIRGPIDSFDAPLLHNINGQIDIEYSGSLDCTKVLSVLQSKGRPKCRKVQPSSSQSSTTGATGKVSATYISPAHHGGLSQAQKIGIGVGVGVGVPLLILGAFVLWYRSRRSRSRSPGPAKEGQYPVTERNGPSRSPVRYTKVPAASTTIEERSSEEQRPASSLLGDNWSPPEQKVPTMDGRVELEEQQGPRHEMDARSLPDIDMDDDEEETRSLQDIERSHERTS